MTSLDMQGEIQAEEPLLQRESTEQESSEVTR